MIVAGVYCLHLLPLLAILLALESPVLLATAWRQPGRIVTRWSFPLLEGSWNGLALAACLAVVAMVGTLVQLLGFFIGGPVDGQLTSFFSYLVSAPVFFGYLFCYALTASLWGDWLRRRGNVTVTALHLFTIMLILAGLANAVTYLIACNPHFHGREWLLAGDVFAFFSEKQYGASFLPKHAVVVLAWGLLLQHWRRRIHAHSPNNG